MKLPVGHPYRLAVVYWRDAVLHSGENDSAEVAQRPVGLICVCAGWLVKDTIEGVTIAAEYEAERPEVYRSQWDIPRGMIERIAIFEPVKRKSRTK